MTFSDYICSFITDIYQLIHMDLENNTATTLLVYKHSTSTDDEGKQ